MTLFATGVLATFAAIEICIAMWKLMQCSCLHHVMEFILDILATRVLWKVAA